jgi:hypothetical protein
VIDRDPSALDELHADHLHRALRDFFPVHSDVKLSHHAPVNLHGDDLNLVQMDVMKMDDRLMIHLMKDDQKMDDRNYLVDLNFRDVRPCAHSLISIKLICFDHTIISQEVFLTK